jgi:hypothetical protein
VNEAAIVASPAGQNVRARLLAEFSTNGHNLAKARETVTARMLADADAMGATEAAKDGIRRVVPIVAADLLAEARRRAIARRSAHA